MEMMWLGLGLGIGASLIAVAALATARAGGLGRAWWGLAVAGRAARDPSLGAKIEVLAGLPAIALPPPSAPTAAAAPPKPTGEALRLLALLQTEARLVDFLMEDIGGAPDAAVGAGVREIHKKASAVLKKYVVLEAIVGGSDGDRVTVAAGFDPSAVRVLGNVTGEPPYVGELQHPGWKAKELKLPGIAEGQDPFVIQPAEVMM